MGNYSYAKENLYYEDVPGYSGYRVLVDKNDNGGDKRLGFKDVNGRWWMRLTGDEQWDEKARGVNAANMSHWDDPDDIKYVYNLPETIIKPEEWQTKLVNAFKDTDVLKEVEEQYNKGFGPWSSDMLNPNLSTLWEWYENYRKYVPNNELLDLQTFKEMLLKEQIEKLVPFRGSLNDVYKRLYNTWVLAKKPKVVSLQTLPDEHFEDVSGHVKTWGTRENPRAFMTGSFSNYPTMYILTLSDAVAEMAHPIQWDFGQNNRFINHYDYFRFEDSSDPKKGQYGNPKAFEHETHYIIEPQLKDYIYNNNIPDFLKQGNYDSK